MKRLLACLLSFTLLFTPLLASATTGHLTTGGALSFLVNSLSEVLSGEQTGLEITLTRPEGESVSFGGGTTPTGGSVHYTQNDLAFLVDEVNAYLTRNGSTVSVPLEALAALIACQQAPALTDAELNALMQFGQDFLSRLITSGTFTWNLRSNVFNLHLDLDGFLRHLNTLVPSLLSEYRTVLDPLMTKYTQYLGIDAVTVDQFVAGWTSLGLNAIDTGLVLDVFGFQTTNGLSLITSYMDWNIQVTFHSVGFSFTAASPAGIAYSFDTADLMTVASIFSTVPNAITEEAFQVTQTTEQSLGEQVITTHITTDFALLERDLRLGLTQSITANEMTVNTLSAKYQPWVDLLFKTTTVVTPQGETIVRRPTPQISAAWLIQQIGTLHLLPAVNGELTVVSHPDQGTVDLDGYLGDVLFDAHLLDINRRAMTFDASLRVPDADGSFALLLSGCTDRFGSPTFTITCSEDLGGFHALTFTQTAANRYNNYQSALSVTTDTDVFHLVQSTGTLSNTFDLKAGHFNLFLDVCSRSHTGKPLLQLHSSWMDGFVDMTVTNSGMALDSTIGGFSFTETRQALRIEGYINENPRTMTPSTFSALIDGENELLQLMLLPADGNHVHLTYLPGELSIRADGSVLTISEEDTGTAAQNVIAVRFDGQLMASVVTDLINNEDVMIRIWLGETTDAACWTLHFDFGAAGKVAPAGATAVTAEEFIRLVNTIPDPSAPSTPDADVPAEPEQTVDTDLDTTTELESGFSDGLLGP